MEKTGRPWSVPVAVAEIPDTGLHVEIDAPAEARAGVAALAGVRDIARLCASFDLTRRGEGVHVGGRVQARVGQTCVVTLDPVDSAVDEAVDVEFMPGGGRAAAGQLQAAAEDEEPPEPLVGGTLDLGALATEFLVLGIDRYPRKPGAEFTPPAPEEPGERPFAALEALKKRLGGGPR